MRLGFLSCLLVLLLGLQACAVQPVKVAGLRFNSVEVINLSNDDVFNMKIEVTRFHRKFACGIILHRSICMNGFHERVLEENEVEISWEQKGRQHSVGPFKVNAPQNYDPDRVYSAQFILHPDKRFEVSFAPSSY